MDQSLRRKAHKPESTTNSIDGWCLLMVQHSHRKRCIYCRATHQLTVDAICYGVRCDVGTLRPIGTPQCNHVQAAWNNLERLQRTGEKTIVKSMPSRFANPRGLQAVPASTCESWSTCTASCLSGLNACCMAAAAPLAGQQRTQKCRPGCLRLSR